jgi:hypothetical protein
MRTLRAAASRSTASSTRAPDCAGQRGHTRRSRPPSRYPEPTAAVGWALSGGPTPAAWRGGPTHSMPGLWERPAVRAADRARQSAGPEGRPPRCAARPSRHAAHRFRVRSQFGVGQCRASRPARYRPPGRPRAARRRAAPTARSYRSRSRFRSTAVEGVAPWLPSGRPPCRAPSPRRPGRSAARLSGDKRTRGVTGSAAIWPAGGRRAAAAAPGPPNSRAGSGTARPGRL